MWCVFGEDSKGSYITPVKAAKAQPRVLSSNLKGNPSVSACLVSCWCRTDKTDMMLDLSSITEYPQAKRKISLPTIVFTITIQSSTVTVERRLLLPTIGTSLEYL